MLLLDTSSSSHSSPNLIALPPSLSQGFPSSHSKKDNAVATLAPSDTPIAPSNTSPSAQNAPATSSVEISTRPSEAPGLSAVSISNAPATSATVVGHNPTDNGGEDRPESTDSDDEEFLGLLKQAPDISKETRERALLDTNVAPEINVIGVHSSAEKSHIWRKAKEAQDAGDDILANILLKAYKDLDQPVTKPTPARSISANPILVPVGAVGAPAEAPTETEEEDDLIYAIGAVTNHQDIGFTPYFDKNIKKLKAPLPLTIFDRDWQKKAIAAHLSVKPSKSSEDKAYRGLPFHSEWTQTHSRWTNNHRAFHLTLRDVYNKTRFAEKLLQHKENCDEISDEFGFMTAFRYDMQIRSNAFAHRVPTKNGAAIPDIAVKQTLIAERCYNTVRSAGETNWTDNYYAPGGSHSHINPDTGRERLVRSASYNPKGVKDHERPSFGYKNPYHHTGHTNAPDT
ncbi:hypothetical protein PGTUg99_024726 [Puccinia graminis f. sp. tritici]|uniref:Uncharacterized protein n=1 Tax=Puccinia graminis f. sp. tritici TaxID=56615 RepID=A0A5B0NTW9_PUCGR|nr:hypothetical protein PGTUg99_024726 [Puccinia graminis f. sp. tritici]